MAYELAQINVARAREPLDSARMSEFVAAVDPVNRLADTSDGFIWRLPALDGHVVTTGDDNLVINLSVWRDYPSLHAFVYRSRHGGLVRQRSRWFLAGGTSTIALWWVPAGARPTVDDGLRRLAYLRRYGPTPRAFTLRRRFPAPSTVER